MQNLKYYLLLTAIHHKINETNHFRNWLVFLIPASQENQGFFAFLLCIFISNKINGGIGIRIPCALQRTGFRVRLAMIRTPDRSQRAGFQDRHAVDTLKSKT